MIIYFICELVEKSLICTWVTAGGWKRGRVQVVQLRQDSKTGPDDDEIGSFLRPAPAITSSTTTFFFLNDNSPADPSQNKGRCVTTQPWAGSGYAPLAGERRKIQNDERCFHGQHAAMKTHSPIPRCSRRGSHFAGAASAGLSVHRRCSIDNI